MVAIFARRVVQRVLKQSGRFLSPKQIADHVQKLNCGDAQHRLAAEWQLFVLNAFSCVGRVGHEESLGGSSRLDLVFYCRESRAPLFVADVCAISDEGLHKENPIVEFRNQLYRRIRKCGVQNGALHINVACVDRLPQRDKKLRLALPDKGEIGSFIKSELHQFIDDIVAAPLQAHRAVVNRRDVELTISFDPRATMSFTHYPEYALAYHNEQNPVSAALRRKANQSRLSGFDGIRGVVLCDAGCKMLYPTSSRGPHYSLVQLVNRFLVANKSLGFVLVVGVVEEQRLGSNAWVRRVVTQLFPNFRAHAPLSEPLKAILLSIDEHFPKPRLSAINARNLLQGNHPNSGENFVGAYVMQGSPIKIPASSFVELMAGVPPRDWPVRSKPTVGEFNPDVTSFFKRHLIKGCSIESIHIEAEPDLDDDWIVIKFGPPNPALSPYANPSAK